VIFSALLIVVALLLINAVYVGAEFSAVSARRSRIRQLAEDGNVLAAWLLPLVESPAALDRYIAACQIGITLSSLILGAFAQRTLAVWLTPLVTDWGGMQEVAAQSTSVGIVLLVLTVGQVIFGELIPKSLALQYPTQTALYTLVPMVPSLWVYRPFIRWLNGSGVLLLRLLGSPSQTHRHIHSPDEIELLIAESRDGGLLEPDEHRRLQRALRLNLRQAKQLMVSRRRISALDRSRSLSRRARTHGCPSIEAPSTTSWGCFTPRTSSGGASAARTMSLLPPC
jgi:CBS domain containing-hemolysin-like protein